jgi:hypothetical protein
MYYVSLRHGLCIYDPMWFGWVTQKGSAASGVVASHTMPPIPGIMVAGSMRVPEIPVA